MVELDERYLNVDKHGRLRPPAAFWLAMLFLSRHVILVIVLFVSARRAPDVMRLIGGTFPWFMLLLEAPTIALLLAASRREAGAARIWRTIWHNGRAIVLLMAAVHIGIAGWVLVQSDFWRTWPELFIASCSLIDVAIALAIGRDPYFKQLFADFPEPQQT